MRALTLEEARVLRECASPIKTISCTTEDEKVALESLVETSRVSHRWVPHPHDPQFNVAYYTATRLGRIALRVALPGMSVPL